MTTMPQVGLVLTSCIQVGDPQFVQRNQTEVRLRDYQTTLRHWLTRQSCITKIIFCDNSGYSLDSLKQIVKEINNPNIQIEFLSYHLTDYQGKGFGWGEIDIYDHIVKNSRLWLQLSHIGFCSGRRFVKNIQPIVAAISPQADIVTNFLFNLVWADGDLYFVRREVFADTMLPKYKALIDDSKKWYMERALAKLALQIVLNSGYWYPLVQFPLYEGVAGKKNLPLNQRKEGWWLYNQLATGVSRLYWYVTKTAVKRAHRHWLDQVRSQ